VDEPEQVPHAFHAAPRWSADALGFAAI